MTVSRNVHTKFEVRAFVRRRVLEELESGTKWSRDLGALIAPEVYKACRGRLDLMAYKNYVFKTIRKMLADQQIITVGQRKEEGSLRDPVTGKGGNVVINRELRLNTVSQLVTPASLPGVPTNFLSPDAVHYTVILKRFEATARRYIAAGNYGGQPCLSTCTSSSAVSSGGKR